MTAGPRYRSSHSNGGQVVSSIEAARGAIKARGSCPAQRAAGFSTLAAVVAALAAHLRRTSSGGGVADGKGPDAAAALQACDTLAAAHVTSKEAEDVRVAAFAVLEGCAPPCSRGGCAALARAPGVPLERLSHCLTLCRIAAAAAPHLLERRASRWNALAALCSKYLLRPSAPVAVRRAAAAAVAALVAAPWAVGAAADGAPAAAPETVAAKLRETALSKFVEGPRRAAVASEDRCAPAATLSGGAPVAASCCHVVVAHLLAASC